MERNYYIIKKKIAAYRFGLELIGGYFVIYF